MFSLFRKKKQPPPTPQPNLSKERAYVAKIYGSAYEKTLSNSQVKKLVNFIQENEEKETRRTAKEAELEFEENQQNLQRFVKQLSNEETAEKAAFEAAEQAQSKRALTRNQRLNTITRKHLYKNRQNLMNNAARQRKNWREKNPSAPYMSIENFANSNFFTPHNLYTGTTNNNASTISLNSPRSIHSNRPYSPFGGRRKTHRRSRH